MKHALYVKLIKEAMVNMEAQGQTPKDQNVENALFDLASIGNDSIDKTIENYRTKKKDLVNEFNNVNDKLIKLIDETYNAILKIDEGND